MPSKRELQLELIRRKCFEEKTGFFYFAKHVYGNCDMQVKVHGDVCEVVSRPFMSLNGKGPKASKVGRAYQQLVLMPRSNFKSSVITEALPLWCLAQNPNLRIFITNEDLNKSENFLRNIEACIRMNELFIELFGDWYHDESGGRPEKTGRTWKNSALTISARTRPIKEPSISTGSPESSKTSMHFDLVIADDLVSEKNTNTINSIKKTLDYDRQIFSLIDTGGKYIRIGTRYDRDDLYGHVLGEASTNETRTQLVHDVIVKRAYWTDPATGDTKYLFPEKWGCGKSTCSRTECQRIVETGVPIEWCNKEVLDALKPQLGPYKFGCQYLNQPTNKDTAVFTQDMFLYIGEHAELPSNMEPPKPESRILFVDPSMGQSKDSDFTGMVVCAFDQRDRIFVLDAKQERIKPKDLVDRIFDLHERWQFDRICLEAVSMQKILYEWICDKQEEKGIDLPIIPVNKGNTTSKDMHIMAMEPRFRSGKVFFAKGLSDLEEQLIHYPNTRYDDLIDALAFFTIQGAVVRPDRPRDPFKDMSPKERWHYNTFTKRIVDTSDLGPNGWRALEGGDADNFNQSDDPFDWMME